ncbi:MAG: beta-ketoacyl-[acyl-carrier-protein] synthase II [Chloroflexi bacterium RBG_16_48_8]|nr:MAG: beta-ketoacyl-[acyl-carrier-protein] synthase II [Chloroflexi bacterium RBG_16_48_8]
MASDNRNVRIVITGLGVLTPLGSDLTSFWDALIRGESGVRRITQFDASDLPCQIAGEVLDYHPEEYMPLKEARRLSRASQLGLAAAQKAISDSGLKIPFTNPERVGVYFGTGIGGFERAIEGVNELEKKGLARLNPFYLPSAIPNMPAFHVTQTFGALGPNSTITTACATGTQAVGEAAQVIRCNRADILICGGVEAMIQHFAIAGFCSMRALPTSFNDNPSEASRPFDAKREGFVFSEGAACLILERLDHALERKAHIYAEVAGYASSSDGFHIAAPDPEAKGPIRTMKWALEDAEISVAEIDYINAHGTSTLSNDSVETLAIKQLFGERAYSIPISSTKSMIGHAMGGSGAIEAAVCALTIEKQMIHPTINYEFPDPECDLDYVPNHARKAEVKTALSNSFGLGSQNACLVFRKVNERC